MRSAPALTALALALSLLVRVAAAQLPPPLPPPAYPAENPPRPGQDVLGKFLFWDEQLSHDDTMACGTCHRSEIGGSDPRSARTFHPGPDGLFATADDVHGSAGTVHLDLAAGFVADPLFGAHAQVTRRKAPSTIGAAYFERLFWDGRATGQLVDPQTRSLAIAAGGALESQAAVPPVGTVEMSADGRTWDDVVAKLAAVEPAALAVDLPPEMRHFLGEHPTYPDMFAAVYGDPAITSERVLFAIANYERTLVADQTVLDTYLRGEIRDFPTDAMQRGFNLFTGDARCSSCHPLPFLQDGGFHNIGVRPDAEDVGLMAVTGDPADIGKFKTPDLRNAPLRGHLFHTGTAKTVADTLALYDVGGLFDTGHLDPELIALDEILDAQDMADLQAFLEGALVDPRVEQGSFPFTRPRLRSEQPASHALYGVASPNAAGRFAEFVLPMPAHVGHLGFTVGVERGLPSQPCALVLAGRPGTGAPFRDPRFAVPVNVQLGSILELTLTATDRDGMASVPLPLPPTPSLVGQSLYLQWFLVDPALAATGGVYATRGARLDLF
jgi:cytochrome c peroxidase